MNNTKQKKTDTEEEDMDVEDYLNRVAQGTAKEQEMKEARKAEEEILADFENRRASVNCSPPPTEPRQMAGSPRKLQRSMSAGEATGTI